MLEIKASYKFFITLFLLLTFFSHAQNSKPSSTDNRISTRLQSHILIHQDSIPLSFLKPIFEKQTPIALKLGAEEIISTSFLNEYRNYYNIIVVISDSSLEPILNNNIEIVQIRDNEVEQLIFESVKFIDEKDVRFRSLEKYYALEFNNNKISDSLFLKFWEKSGKIPNFINASKHNLKVIETIVTKINSTRKVFGIISSESEMLQDVSFKNFKNRSASGYFSFPIDEMEGLPILIPFKAGFHFSPDIIYVTPENFNNLKEFTAFKLDLDFGLTDYFKFGQTIDNLKRKNDSEIISNNLKIENDADFGKVGLFENRAYVDAGIDSKSSLKGSFTISAWINPIQLNNNNSILGKGDNFVLKLHEGYLTFTMAGIKDYISKTSPIPVDEWSHISLVHSKINNELLFYVNGELTDKVELIADYITSDYNLLVGSNLWEEFFIGYIGEIKIWDRELNSNEILLQYKMPQNNSLGYSKLWYFLAGVVAITFLFFFILKLRKRRSKKNSNKLKLNIVERKNNINASNQNFIEEIRCFGELQIINNKGADIATKLSPKLKSLFILIFLHSSGNKKGINSKKLSEALWPGMSTKSAKNTRGTNIQNLRTILSTCSEIKLSFQDKKWRLNFSDRCFCDYHLVLNYFENILKVPYDKASLEIEIPKLTSVLKEGRFFRNSNFSWLDPFIEKFSNLVIEKNSEFISQFEIQYHTELLYNLAEVITIYDDLNEKSLELKLKILRYQGKLSLAFTVYDNYIKLYRKIYKEDYKQSFEVLISEKNTI